MGGARGGAVASSIAVSVLEEEFVRGLLPGLHSAAIRELMERAAQHANREIYDLACADPSKRGMGTTMVAMVLKNGWRTSSTRAIPAPISTGTAAWSGSPATTRWCRRWWRTAR